MDGILESLGRWLAALVVPHLRFAAERHTHSAEDPRLSEAWAMPLFEAGDVQAYVGANEITSLAIRIGGELSGSGLGMWADFPEHSIAGVGDIILVPGEQVQRLIQFGGAGPFRPGVARIQNAPSEDRISGLARWKRMEDGRFAIFCEFPELVDVIDSSGNRIRDLAQFPLKPLKAGTPDHPFNFAYGLSIYAEVPLP